MRHARLLAILHLVATMAGCAWRNGPLPPKVTVSAPIDDVVPVLVELVRAHNVGSGEVLRVLQERFGARAELREGAVVVGAVGASAKSTAPVLLAFSLTDVPACADVGGGVVSGEPPRVMGCGAQALAGLAAFVVAAEQIPGTPLVLTTDGVLPSMRASRAWLGSGGGLTRGVDGDVFDLDVVDSGGVRLSLSRRDGDGDALLVAVGRALAWRSPAHLPVVLADRAAMLPTGLFGAAPNPPGPDRLQERCRMDALPTTTTADMSCHVLPGRTPADTRDDVLRAIADPGVAVVKTSSHGVTATGFSDPLVLALRARLAEELPRVVVAPWLRVASVPGPCSRLRSGGVPCVGGVPLALHRFERSNAGSADDSVDTAELARLASRVSDVVRALTPSSSASTAPDN